MNISAEHTALDIPECTAIQNIQQATLWDDHLKQVKDHII